jgi:anti-sigma regulatory factor (Ser/Thr protein kinase)
MAGKLKKEINFLDSFSADTSIVPSVINSLMKNLEVMNYPRDEIDEIVLSMDEAITNAVQETIRKKNHECIFCGQEERREITIRYNITDNDFDATIIDHGRGLNVDSLVGIIPDSASHDYHSQIVRYATESEKKKLTVRVNGKEVALKGIGAGLKIILAFMDNITIDLIDKKKIISDSVSEFTDGTILNLKRGRRYTQ